jgi:hypothetical protein
VPPPFGQAGRRARAPRAPPPAGSARAGSQPRRRRGAAARPYGKVTIGYHPSAAAPRCEADPRAAGRGGWTATSAASTSAARHASTCCPRGGPAQGRTPPCWRKASGRMPGRRRRCFERGRPWRWRPTAGRARGRPRCAPRTPTICAARSASPAAALRRGADRPSSLTAARDWRGHRRTLRPVHTRFLRGAKGAVHHTTSIHYNTQRALRRAEEGA